jgi:proton-translocating NADH-quinone oxidoreductase chain N
MSSYLVIEMQTLSFYILASFKRTSSFSTEAGLKYFISGSFISIIFLFGCSLIYGALGTLNFNNLNILMYFPFNFEDSISQVIFIGIILVTATLLFKISSVPLHFWSPDVYEGSPLASTIIFSILPKLAVFHFFIRWISIISNSFEFIRYVFLFLGVLSLLVGTFFAIGQKRIKKLLIYSSIAQGGFLISALSNNSLYNFTSVYFFLIIYLITSILSWINLSNLYSSKVKTTVFYNRNYTPLFLSNLSNFFHFNNTWALSFVVIFFSMAGIPPLSGFFSKFFILYGLISSGDIVVALLLIIISAVSTFYYLRIIKIIYFETIESNLKIEDCQITFNDAFVNYSCIILSLFSTLLILTFFYPTALMLYCNSLVLGSFYF